MQFRGDYYITGDKATMDEDGYFWFEGRGDDIIISSGYTIGPFEVEDALVKHPYVRECAVVASPDEVRGHVVKAFIVLQENISVNEELIALLQNHVKELTAPYKYPRKIEFVEELPKTTSGKIRRIDLRKRELEPAAD
jgi:acetyl-CoA synthetase